MTFCNPHWAGLRQALDDRGLTPLVAKNGQACRQKMNRQLSGEGETAETFEPLIQASMAIIGNAIQAGGPYPLTVKADGSEYCPICESEANGGYPAAWWFDNAADEQLRRARGLGLLPPPS